MTEETAAGSDSWKWMMGAAALVVLVLVALAWVLMGVAQQRQLHRQVARTDLEIVRLEFIFKRHDELTAEVARLRSAVEQAKALREHREPTPLARPTAETGLPPMTPPPPISWNPMRSREVLRALQDMLEQRNRLIQAGINLERKLPRLDGEVAELKAELEQLQAAQPAQVSSRGSGPDGH